MKWKSIVNQALVILTLPIYFLVRIASAAIYRSKMECEKRKQQIGDSNHGP